MSETENLLTLERVQTEWAKDSVIDPSEPTNELARVPQLHSKYTTYLSHFNLGAKKHKRAYNRLRRLKWLYYTGKIDEHTLKELGWKPFSYILKSDISIFMESDIDLIKIEEKMNLEEEGAYFCTNVVKELNNRTFQLNNLIKWEMFMAGAN